MDTFDFCIIGAGVIGTALARELSRYDKSIVVVDSANDVSMGCTKANSGILHGGYDAVHGTLKSQLAYKGNQLYDRWNEELQFGINRCGAFVVAFSAEEQATLGFLKENGEKNGITDLSIISKEELREHEPRVSKSVVSALRCSYSGVVSPYEVAIALAENAAQNGVVFTLKFPVCAIHMHDDTGFWELQSETKSILARTIINCAGVHADEIASMCGVDRYKVTPVRGCYYVFQRGYMPVRSVLFQTPNKNGKGILVAPTYHGNLLIGPDAEVIEDKDASVALEERLNFIVQKAQKTIPELDMSKTIRAYAGVRPKSRAKDFIISMDTTNLLNLIGIDSPGLTSAPAIVAYVINVLKSNGHALTVRPSFDPSRKRIIECQATRNFLPMKEAAHLAELSQGSSNRIVCRCEQVYERTILHAMRRCPQSRSTDAIKRRTRAGMGICQGKFCKSRVRALLSEHWNVPIEKIEEK